VGLPGTEPIDNEALLELNVDVLIPAALGEVITDRNADRIRARLIVEAANHPVTPVADAILNDRGVLIVPDILANAGGVTVSYFEWVQNRHGVRWTREEVAQRLERSMRTEAERVCELAGDYSVPFRTAAYALALRRIGEAVDACGSRETYVSGATGS
jgi:glutamate dehydrogenase (NADP+)